MDKRGLARTSHSHDYKDGGCIRLDELGGLHFCNLILIERTYHRLSLRLALPSNARTSSNCIMA